MLVTYTGWCKWYLAVTAAGHILHEMVENRVDGGKTGRHPPSPTNRNFLPRAMTPRPSPGMHTRILHHCECNRGDRTPQQASKSCGSETCNFACAEDPRGPESFFIPFSKSLGVARQLGYRGPGRRSRARTWRPTEDAAPFCRSFAVRWRNGSPPLPKSFLIRGVSTGAVSKKPHPQL